MYKSEELRKREVGILGLLLDRGEVRSAKLRDMFFISKATLSTSISNIRERTGLDIVAGKNGRVVLRDDKEKALSCLEILQFEPITQNVIYGWMIMFLLSAEGGAATFKIISEGITEFFGTDISDSLLRKILSELKGRELVDARVLPAGNNAYTYSLCEGAPVEVGLW